MNPLCPVIASDQQDPQKVGIGLVGVVVCAWSKTSYFHGIYESSVFLKDDVDVPIGEEQKVHQFIGYRELIHGMAEGEDRYCAQQGNHGQKDCVGFNGNLGGTEYTLFGGD